VEVTLGDGSGSGGVGDRKMSSGSGEREDGDEEEEWEVREEEEEEVWKDGGQPSQDEGEQDAGGEGRDKTEEEEESWRRSVRGRETGMGDVDAKHEGGIGWCAEGEDTSNTEDEEDDDDEKGKGGSCESRGHTGSKRCRFYCAHAGTERRRGGGRDAHPEASGDRIRWSNIPRGGNGGRERSGD
jgi:hypothetical protein